MWTINLLRYRQTTPVARHESKSKKKVYDFTVTGLLALCLAVILANLIWLGIDQRPPAWDESIHYMGAFGYYQTLLKGGAGCLHQLLYQSDFYPPLTEFAAAIFFLFIHPSPDAAILVNLLFLLGTIGLLYILGRIRFGKEAGLLAGFFLVASSAVVMQSKFFMLDLAQMFFVTFGFLAFLQSEQFAKKRWAAVYGVVFGLALLNKWSALFFFLPIPMVVLVMSLLQSDEKRFSRLGGVLIACGIAGILAGPWYWIHFIKLVKNTKSYIYQRGELEGDPALLSPASWFYYFGSLMQDTSWPLGSLMLGGVVWYFITRFREQASRWMGLWLLVPYLILTMIRNKDNRYFLPFIPIIALLSLTWLQQQKEPLRRSLALILAFFCLLQFIYCHQGTKAGVFYALSRMQLLGIPIIASQAPSPGEWPIAGILADVEELGKSLGRPPVLRVIPDDSAFSKVTFVVAQTQRAKGVELSATSDWPAFTDFAITKTGSLGLPFNIERARRITDALANSTSAEGQRFIQVREYPLPDGSQARLYQRRESMGLLLPEQINALLQAKVSSLLSAYLQAAQQLKITIQPYSETETRMGHFRSIGIQAEGGLLGDFKHKPLGVPVARVALEIKDIRLDLAALQSGQLLPYWVGELSVVQVVLRDSDINQALSKAERNLQPVRVSFQQQRLAVRYMGKIPAEAILQFQVVKDKNQPGSENLTATVQSLLVNGLTIPGWLIRPMLEDFNPLFQLTGFPGKIKLGRLTIEESRLQLGNAVGDRALQ